MTGDWTARLGGDDRSLRKLASWFTQGRHRIKHEDGVYHLTSPDLIACHTNGEAWTVAERIVRHINRGAKVDDRHFRPVHVAAILEPSGKQHYRLQAGLGAYVVDWPSSPPLAEKLAELQESEGPDSAVSRALEQWSLPEQTPTSLNNVLENIREDIWGGVPKVEEGFQAWMQMARTLAPAMAMSVQQLDDELRRCRKSLQSQMAVGSLARHGSSRPVTNPMNLDEARGFVHRLLLVWLRSKV